MSWASAAFRKRLSIGSHEEGYPHRRRRIGLCHLEVPHQLHRGQKGFLGKVAVAYGARTRQDLYFMQEYKGWQQAGIDVSVTVDIGDEGWKGNVDMVPALIDKFNLPAGSAAICGPSVMINAVASKLMARGFDHSDIYVSMERHMKCGVGKCEHCCI